MRERLDNVSIVYIASAAIENHGITRQFSVWPVSELEDEISRAYSLLSHLNGVKNSPELRETLEKIQVRNGNIACFIVSLSDDFSRDSPNLSN